MSRLSLWLLFVSLSASACGGTAGGFISATHGDGGTCTDTWSTFGAAFFSSNCGGCHSNLRSHSSVSASASSVRSVVVSGRMPPNGLTWADEQRAVLYLDCGAP